MSCSYRPRDGSGRNLSPCLELFVDWFRTSRPGGILGIRWRGDLPVQRLQCIFGCQYVSMAHGCDNETEKEEHYEDGCRK